MKSDRSPLLTRQEATALISCVVNLVLTVFKFILFYRFVKSVSLKAEAWHSLSDIGSSFIVYLALLLGRRQLEKRSVAQQLAVEPEQPSSRLFSEPQAPAPEAPDHQPARPERTAKPEDVVAVGIACLFILVCFGIFAEILAPSVIETDSALAVAAGMLAMAYVSYLLYKFEYRVGVESDSPGLIADGYHSKIDMYGSLLVAVALVCQYFHLEWADRIVAAFICLGILGHAVEVLAMAARHYLGRPIDDKGHVHGSALSDVYALTGRWGEAVSRTVTRAAAAVLLMDTSRPALGRRVARRVVTVLVLGAALLYALSGLFACDAGQQAFVERFGKPTTDEPYGPGLHYRWPWPVDRVVRVDVKQIRTFYLGTPAHEKGQPILWTNRHYTTEFRFLTGDENFLTAFVAVHFRIGDLRRYLYECQTPVAVLANACRAKMREVVGTKAFQGCLTRDRPELESRIHDALEPLIRDVGLEVVAVSVRDIHPPLDVAPAFEEVISAMEEKEAIINEAQAYAVGAVPLAQGRAALIRADADAYMKRVEEEAAAEVGAFVALQQQYALARNITTARLYLEMLEDCIAKTPKWVVLTGEGSAPLDLWFPKGAGFWRWLAAPGRKGDPPK